MLSEQIFSDAGNIRMGILVSTYGSVPYVHLQLESWRRFGARMPMLVHDDGSEDGDALRALCEKYSAAFLTTGERKGWLLGDLTSFIRGFEWAAENGVELLVKLSRRWIPLVPWQESLAAFAKQSQYATYSAGDVGWGFRFRTEAVALHVASWLRFGGVTRLQEYAALRQHAMVEWIFYRAVQDVYKQRCVRNIQYELTNPPRKEAQFFGSWQLLGDSRVSPQADVLWHEWARPHEYRRALRQWNIDNYPPEAFVDPTQNVYDRVIQVVAGEPT